MGFIWWVPRGDPSKERGILGDLSPLVPVSGAVKTGVDCISLRSVVSLEESAINAVDAAPFGAPSDCLMLTLLVNMVWLIDTTGSYVRLVFKRQSSGACSIFVMIATPDDWHIYIKSR